MPGEADVNLNYTDQHAPYHATFKITTMSSLIMNVRLSKLPWKKKMRKFVRLVLPENQEPITILVVDLVEQIEISDLIVYTSLYLESELKIERASTFLSLALSWDLMNNGKDVRLKKVNELEFVEAKTTKGNAMVANIEFVH